MLKHVIDDFLDHATERDLDLPLYRLLWSMGFTEIHVIHGNNEFGKDIIAKLVASDGTLVQYSFQSKAGNVSNSDWQRIQWQLRDAIINPLGHPSFDSNIPHQVVLVTSGHLVGNAKLGAQSLNNVVVEKGYGRRLVYWEKNDLSALMVQFALDGAFQPKMRAVERTAKFFEMYSDSLKGILRWFDFEEYSRYWSNENVRAEDRLNNAIEASLLAQEYRKLGQLHDECMIYAALARAEFVTNYGSWDERSIIAVNQLIALIGQISSDYLTEFNGLMGKHGRISKFPGSGSSLAGYAVICSQSAEMLGLAYFCNSDTFSGKIRDDAIDLLASLALTEKGISCPIGDRFAVSLAFACLALLDAGKVEVVAKIVETAAVWLCDRIEFGSGIADWDADESEVIMQLIGYPFDFTKVEQISSSILASLLVDVSAIASLDDLYSDVVNDLMAVDAIPCYWSFKDDVSTCVFESEAIVHWPNVRFPMTIEEYSKGLGSRPLSAEQGGESLLAQFGPASVAIVSLFLRDRYFPHLWPKLLAPE